VFFYSSSLEILKLLTWVGSVIIIIICLF
jgi:hypothetical protein